MIEYSINLPLSFNMFFLSVMPKDYKYHIHYLKGIFKSNIKIRVVPFSHLTSPMQILSHKVKKKKQQKTWLIMEYNSEIFLQYRVFSPASGAAIFYEMENNMLDVKFFHWYNRKRQFELLIVPEKVKRPVHMCNV